MRRTSWWWKWLGVELDQVSWKEKFISGLGGALAIFLLILVCHDALHLAGAAMLIASMAATAVLLFAIPHGALSQPWPVIGGHAISAVIGVFCANHLPHLALAAACAVGVSIFVMHVAKCLHPPGAATALTAVIGGPEVHGLGYGFIWSPVVLNALMIVLVAIVFNLAFPWRRYPAVWGAKPKGAAVSTVTHEEVVAALESFDTFVDITEDDLIRLHEMLSRRIGARVRKVG